MSSRPADANIVLWLALFLIATAFVSLTVVRMSTALFSWPPPEMAPDRAGRPDLVSLELRPARDLRCWRAPLIRLADPEVRQHDREPLIARLADAEVRQRVEALLADSAFAIEYHGYFTNHAKHAVIALAGLGAGAARIQGYYDWYARRLELRADGPGGEPVTRSTWRELVGKKERFGALCAFFEAEAARLGGAREAVRAYGPELLRGMAGALTHTVIHLGWALDAGSAPMTIEGLAYSAYGALPIRPERFTARAHADGTVVASLLRAARTWSEGGGAAWAARVKADPKYSREAGFHPERIGGFSRTVAALLEDGHEILYELPDWLDAQPVSHALRQLYEASALLYLVSAGGEAGKGTGRAPGAPGAGPGSFILLHLITSLWGVEHTMGALASEEERRQALRCFWASLVAIPAATDRGLPTADEIAAALARFPLEALEAKAAPPAAAAPALADEVHPAKCAAAGDNSDAWADVAAAAVQEHEEHNIKLVYVVRELRSRYGDGWAGWLAAANTFTSS